MQQPNLIDRQTAMKKWRFVVSVIALLWMVFSITFNLRVTASSLDQLDDFGSFIASGIELKEGRNPYGISSPLIFEIYFPRVNSGGILPNLNPPITLIIFELLGDSDFILTINIWRLL